MNREHDFDVEPLRDKSDEQLLEEIEEYGELAQMTQRQGTSESQLFRYIYALEIRLRRQELRRRQNGGDSGGQQ